MNAHTRRFVFSLTALLIFGGFVGGDITGAQSARLPTVHPGLTRARHASVQPAYKAARAQWIGDGAVVSGAVQDTALYIATFELRQARGRATNPSSYTAAIRAITDFESVPITGVTAAQETEVKADIAVVDRFFGLVRNPWERGCLASGPGIRGAAKAWASEPVGTSHGLSRPPLRAASEMLSLGLRTDSGDRSCYPAAIADLAGLESATRSQVAASSKPWSLESYSKVQVVSAEIAYLNAFFGPSGVQPVLT